MVTGPLVEPAWADHPAVVTAVEVASLRTGERRLIPRMALVDRITERIVGDECLLLGPVVVVGAAEQDPHAEVDVDQVGGDELVVHDDAGRYKCRATRLG